jgi:hypothetical protein
VIREMISAIVEKKVWHTRKDERGMVLLSAMIGVLVLTLICGAYMSTFMVENRLTSRTWDSLTGINVAEAGAELAFWELEYGGGDFLSIDGWAGANPITRTGFMQTSAGDVLGEYFISVTNPTTDTPTIESTGFVPNQAAAEVQRIVRIAVEPDYIFDMAAFGIDGVSMNSNAITDSYDSGVGPYGGANVGSNGDIGTNSISTSPPAITLDSNAHCNGDAFIGPGGDPATAIWTGASSTISGGQEATRRETEVLSMAPPTGLPVNGDFSLGGDETATMSSSGEYGSIFLDGNSILTIDSDVTIYITGELEMVSNSQLHITNDADVEIYVDGRIYLESNTAVNNISQDPATLAIYGTDSLTDSGDEPGVEFDSNNDFYGTIYAPQSTISVDSNAEFYGAMFGKFVELDSNVQVHYDEALQVPGAAAEGFQVESWQEK